MAGFDIATNLSRSRHFNFSKTTRTEKVKCFCVGYTIFGIGYLKIEKRALEKNMAGSRQSALLLYVGDKNMNISRLCHPLSSPIISMC